MILIPQTVLHIKIQNFIEIHVVILQLSCAYNWNYVLLLQLNNKIYYKQIKMSQRSHTAFPRDLILSVGEATMQSKHEIPYRRPAHRRNKSISQSAMQFQPPIIFAQERPHAARMRYQEPTEGILDARKRGQAKATTLKLVGAAVVDGDGKPQGRADRQNAQGQDGNRRMQELRAEVSGARSISTLHQKFLFALKLLRKQTTYSEGVILVTDIDIALKNMAESQDSSDHVVLQQLVSKQLGLCLERKAQWSTAIEHFRESINLSHKLQRLKSGGSNANMDIEICENMLHISKCRWKLKQVEQTQQGIQEITQRAQLIVDNVEDGQHDSERFQRAIVAHASASKLQGEILEQNDQPQQAHEIFMKAKALLAGAFQQVQTAASTKLMQQLSRAIYRTKLTIKYVQSNAPTYDILNQQPKSKHDATLKQNLTSAYIAKQNRPKFLETSSSGILSGSGLGRNRQHLSLSVNRLPSGPHPQAPEPSRFPADDAVLAANEILRTDSSRNQTLSTNLRFQAYRFQPGSTANAKRATEMGFLTDKMKAHGSRTRDQAQIYKTRSEQGEPLLSSYELQRHSEMLAKNMTNYGRQSSYMTSEHLRPYLSRNKKKLNASASMSDHVQVVQTPAAQKFGQRTSQIDVSGHQSAFQPRTQKRKMDMNYKMSLGLHAANEVQTEKAFFQKKEERPSFLPANAGKAEHSRSRSNENSVVVAKMNHGKLYSIGGRSGVSKGKLSTKENKRQLGSLGAEDSPRKSTDRQKVAGRAVAGTEKNSPTRPFKRGPPEQIRDSVQRYQSYLQSSSAFSPYTLQNYDNQHSSKYSTQKKPVHPVQGEPYDLTAKPNKFVRNYKKNFKWLNASFENSNTRFSGVRSDFYFDRFGKQHDRSLEHKLNSSVSYQGRTSAGDGNHVASQRRTSDTFSAIHSWQMISTSRKDQIAVLKHLQMQKAATAANRSESVGKDGKLIRKSKSKSKSKKGSRSRSRKKAQRKVKKSPKQLAQPRRQNTERDARAEPPLENMEAQVPPQTLKDQDQSKSWEDTAKKAQPNKETIVSGPSLHRTSNELLQTGSPRSPRESLEDNFKRRGGSSLGEDSLHPNQNLQSEGPDLDAAASNSVVKTLAQQVEELRSEQQQQKDILNLVLEKQNLLNEQLAQGKKPVNLPGTQAGQPGGRPDTASFGIDAPDKMQPGAQPGQVKNKMATPRQGRALQVMQPVLQEKAAPKSKQTPKFRRMPKTDPPGLLSSKRIKVRSRTKHKPSKDKQQMQFLSSAMMFDSKMSNSHRSVEPEERIQTASSFKMSYKDGRLLVFKTQRLNKTRQAIEDLSIYADFFEDHQVTLSLRVFSRRERQELDQARKDLVYILYGEICMSSTEFSELCQVYLSQVPWKSDSLEDYVQCLKMVVRAAIEKKDQKVKITEKTVNGGKTIYKVIQKAQFSQAPRRPEVGTVKDLEAIQREQSMQQLTLHSYKDEGQTSNKRSSPSPSPDRRPDRAEESDDDIKILYQGDQQLDFLPELLDHSEKEVEQEEEPGPEFDLVDHTVRQDLEQQPKESIGDPTMRTSDEPEKQLIAEDQQESTLQAAGTTRTDAEGSPRPIVINDTSKEVIVDLTAFLKETVASQEAAEVNENPEDTYREPRQPSVHFAEESTAKSQQLQTLLLEAERLVLAEEFRQGETESEQTEIGPNTQSYADFLSSIGNREKTIRLIVKEKTSQEQFKVKIKCEKDHIKIIAVNLNALQEEMLQSGNLSSSRALGDLPDVQVFQKLDYDPAVVDLVNTKLRTMEPLYQQAFFKRSLQIISKTDGEILDVLLQEDKHEEENKFMETEYMVEGAATLRANYGADTLKLYEDHLELSEAKYSKAVADKLLQVHYASSKIKTALQKHTAKKKLAQKIQAEADKEIYVSRAEEQQQMRSTSSREGDPILPEDASEAVRRVSRQGMFLSSVNKRYAFYYKIHSGGEDAAAAPARLYCWSFYVKILGSRTVTVWQYHRFADDILDQVEESQAQKGDDPCDLLKIFVEKIGRQTADMILREAEDEKVDFSVEQTQALEQANGPSQGLEEGLTVSDVGFGKAADLRKQKLEPVRLTALEERSWEVFWIQNLRQQLHLEL